MSHTTQQLGRAITSLKKYKKKTSQMNIYIQTNSKDEGKTPVGRSGYAEIHFKIKVKKMVLHISNKEK